MSSPARIPRILRSNREVGRLAKPTPVLARAPLDDALPGIGVEVTRRGIAPPTTGVTHSLFEGASAADPGVRGMRFARDFPPPSPFSVPFALLRRTGREGTLFSFLKPCFGAELLARGPVYAASGERASSTAEGIGGGKQVLQARQGHL